jgi:A/G-specific adenine glycosylase
MTKQFEKDREKLISWYRENKRVLPWRASKDPYRIWISEVMLQQTTVAAVVPFYDKFMTRFPTVKDLASATIEDVYECWAGLGYYSRARNLHKAAQMFSQTGFPRAAEKLIEYPGLGPYTSRAIASLAFGEQVGVLDGNVIRVLSRKYGIQSNWWETKERQKLQDIADHMAKTIHNSDLNQGLMELGATICTPKKVMCVMCPWKSDCVSLKKDLIAKIPRKKAKEEFQIWEWTFHVDQKGEKIYLEENAQTPFLKKLMLPPSKAQKLKAKPKKFDFKHGVTKYEIFVTLKEKSFAKTAKTGLWAKRSEIAKVNPTSLMKKILSHMEKSG